MVLKYFHKIVQLGCLTSKCNVDSESKLKYEHFGTNIDNLFIILQIHSNIIIRHEYLLINNSCQTDSLT